MKTRITYLLISFCLMFLACGPSDDAKYFKKLVELEQVLEPSEPVERGELYRIIQQIPSPLEISNLIRESGAKYNENILNDVGNADDYTNKYTQAVNLGVYGTDLGYINIYSKYAASMIYLGSVKDLANELRIGQFFDFNTISRLASNSENIDSILYISTSGFDNMSSYLRDQGRDDVSVLMLVGGWVEALHVITQITKRNPTDELIERVGEQKILLDDIVKIVGYYKHDRYFARIHEELEALRLEMENVRIEIVEGEPEMVEEDGMMIIIDRSESIVKMDKETLNKITKIVFSLRTFLVETDE